MKDPLADVELDRRQALLTPFLILAVLVGAFVVFPGARAAILIGVGIALSIMLHECGHFIAAKRADMKVTEFFIGFGPRIWSMRRGETEYGIKAIPAGGYVRIIGMSNLEEIAPEDEARTFRQAKYKDKALVAVAGVAVNIVIFIVCTFVVLVGRGVPFEPSTQVGGVGATSPAAAAGLEASDWIVGVDGRPVASWDTLPPMIGAAATGRLDEIAEVLESGTTAEAVQAGAIDLGTVPLLRDGEPTGIEAQQAWIAPGTASIALGPDNTVTDVVGDARAAGVQVGDRFAVEAVDLDVVRSPRAVNVQLAPAWIGAELELDADNVVRSVRGAATGAGFEVGDRIVTANLESAGTPAMIETRAAGAASIPVTVLRGGTELTKTMTPTLGVVDLEGEPARTVARVGVSPEWTMEQFSPLTAAKESVVMVGTQTAEVFNVVKRVFSIDGITRHATAVFGGEPDAADSIAAAQQDAERPRSVVGIVDIGSALVDADFWNLFALMAGLNLFLALFNLIPLLPFDGGHLVVATYEKIASTITRRTVRVDYRKLLPITTVVTAIVILYGLSVMFRDIRSAVTG